MASYTTRKIRFTSDHYIIQVNLDTRTIHLHNDPDPPDEEPSICTIHKFEEDESTPLTTIHQLSAKVTKILDQRKKTDAL